MFARPRSFVRLELIHSSLQLRAKIRAVERSLVHLFVAVLAVPPQAI
jgi:hypothetical protein